MDTRKLTKIMLGILAVLCLLIALSALNNKYKEKINERQEEKENEEEILEKDLYNGEDNQTQNYIEETNIEIINFFDLYDYFQTNTDCENMQTYLAKCLYEYQTKAKVFDTTNINYNDEEKTLTFNLVSKTDGYEDEYLVTIEETKTTLQRIK